MIELLKDIFIVLAYMVGILFAAILICGMAIGIVRYFVGRR